MKILLIIDNLGSGGAQNQLSLLALELKNKGFDVTVFTFHPQDFFKSRLLDKDIKCIQERKNGKLGINVIRKLIRLFKKGAYNVAISYLSTPNFYAATAKYFSRSRIKVFTSYRSKTEFNKLSLFNRVILNWSNKIADAIIFNSFHEKDNWVKYSPKLAGKFHTIYNYVDLEKFIPAPQIRTHHQLNLLVVGTLSELKNPEIIIEALSKISGEIEFKIRWIGRKYFNEDPTSKKYFSFIQKLIEKNQLQECWTWVDPTIEIEEEYQNSDCLILASTTEGLPNVVCEAMSSGLPVIISNILDHPKLIEDGKNGFTFNPSKSDDLAVAILKINKQKQQNNLKHFSEHSREIAKSLFSSRNTFAKYESLITELS